MEEKDHITTNPPRSKQQTGDTNKEKEAQRDRDKGCNGQTCVGFRSHAKPEVRGIHQGEDENDDEAGDLGERDQR